MFFRLICELTTFRLLKLITKYVENLTTYSSIENNRWDDAIKSGVHMTAKLQELLNKYPV